MSLADLDDDIVVSVKKSCSGEAKNYLGYINDCVIKAFDKIGDANTTLDESINIILYCLSETNIDNVNISKLVKSPYVLRPDYDLQKISHALIQCGIYDLNILDVSNIEDFSDIFSDIVLSENVKIHIDKWDTSNATTMKGMFMNTNINCDISNFVTDNVTDMSFMFYNNSSLDDYRAADNWKFDKVRSIRDMLTMSAMPIEITHNKDIHRCKDLYLIKQDSKRST